MRDEETDDRCGIKDTKEFFFLGIEIAVFSGCGNPNETSLSGFDDLDEFRARDGIDVALHVGFLAVKVEPKQNLFLVLLPDLQRQNGVDVLVEPRQR